MAGIFVSYRREDSGGYAGRIADGLVERFGEDSVFRDVDSLRGGLSFEAALDQRLRQCAAMVVVIGRQWASIADAQGSRRLAAADDWVRREVEEGLRRSIPVIPALVGGAALPKPDDVPESLRALLKRQAVELRDGRAWAGDLRLLGDDVDAAIAGRTPFPLRHALRWLRRRPWVPAGAAALVAAGIYLAWPEPRPTDVAKPEPPLVLAATSEPLFDLEIADADTCFTHDATTGRTYAEFALRLKPLVADPQRTARAFFGIGKVFDGGRVPDGFEPGPAPCEAPACIAVKLWDRPERPTLVRGGSEGTLVRFDATLPPEVTRVVVYGRFYQQEGAGGIECVIDETRPYAQGTQLPPLVRRDASGKALLCDGAEDERRISIERRAGRYCLK